MKNKILQLVIIIVITILFQPAVTSAAVASSGLSYSTWLAYWKKTASVSDITPHLNLFTEVSPFSYTVKSDGSLIDTALIDQQPWPTLFSATAGSGIKVIPTIAWFSPSAIYKVLSSTKLRASHVQQIVTMVTSYGFDGVDIDYENKTANTSSAFSTFLKQLATALHAKNKTLICSIEPRTPLSSRFVTIPKTVLYANDYTVIGRYCDEVKIMAYDQGNVDIVLNKAKGGNSIYTPIADSDWVKKVIIETLKTISRKKIVLAVPSYAEDFTLTQSANSLYSYSAGDSLSYTDAMALAKSHAVTPTLNSAGELGFMYGIATSTSSIPIMHYVSISDAGAIANEIRLAKAYSLKGVSIFKIDGSEDPQLWNILN